MQSQQGGAGQLLASWVSKKTLLRLQLIVSTRFSYCCLAPYLLQEPRTTYKWPAISPIFSPRGKRHLLGILVLHRNFILCAELEVLKAAVTSIHGTPAVNIGVGISLSLVEVFIAGSAFNYWNQQNQIGLNESASTWLVVNRLVQVTSSVLKINFSTSATLSLLLVAVNMSTTSEAVTRPYRS